MLVLALQFSRSANRQCGRPTEGTATRTLDRGSRTRRQACRIDARGRGRRTPSKRKRRLKVRSLEIDIREAESYDIEYAHSRRAHQCTNWDPVPSDRARNCVPLNARGERLLRKEVIQPHLPVRLPCYDFTPITDPTFDGSFLAVRPPASGVADFRGVTGGVYKARERIHPGVLIRDY